MNREAGYYWIKGGEFQSYAIAKWDGEYFYLCGIEYGYEDDGSINIDENRIKHKSEAISANSGVWEDDGCTNWA